MKELFRKGATPLALAVAAAVIAVCAGFFLPSLVMRVQDGRNESTTGTEEMSFSVVKQSHLPERLMLVRTNDSTISINGGERFADENAAFTQALYELDVLNDAFGRYGGEIYSCDPAELVYASAILSTDSDAGVSAVFWELDIACDDQSNIHIVLDDETGVILSFCHTYADYAVYDSQTETVIQSDSVSENDLLAAATANAFADYLMLEIRDLQPKTGNGFGNVYTVGLSDGETTVKISIELWDYDCFINL